MAAHPEAAVTNDLQAAVEVQQGTGWQVLYPGRSLPLTGQEAALRLREAPHILGRSPVSSLRCLRCSEDFGSFSTEAVQRDRQELEAAAQEKRRQEEVQDCQEAETWKAAAALRNRKLRCIPCVAAIPVLLSVILWVCAVYTMALREDITAADAAFLSTGAMFAGAMLMCLVQRDFHGGGENSSASEFRYGSHASIVPLVKIMSAFSGYTAMGLQTGAFLIADLGWIWTAFITWPPSCYLFWRAESAGFEELTTQEAEILNDERHQARKEVLQRTIVFEGSVLEGLGRPCVCSWPGTYEGAWASLVSASREGDVSAAVVFLPDGTENFGKHDQIPEHEGLNGTCWCVPLYGEEKPWGCRWWSHWIANIEEAVSYGAELEVYYFVDHVGMGKVESFAAAGQEHLRREELNSRRAEFKETDDFKAALKAGLGGLSKRQRGDSSSAYSREVDRLFLAWLPEEERKFLLAAEGLGNSQKAEVAWLEHKGYRYVEKDVSLWSSGCMEEVHLEAVAPTQAHMGPSPKFHGPGRQPRESHEIDLPGAVAPDEGVGASFTNAAE